MTYNFHTHTKRCKHASDSEREYVERAILCGIKHMGFSDHAPFIYPNGYEEQYRVPMCEAKAYVADVCALRDEFKDRIDISVGFEMEYYPKYFDTMLKNVKEAGAEYLILGQHFVYNGCFDGFHVVKENSDDDALKDYVNSVIAGIKSRKFTYVAHPDIFNYEGDEKLYADEMRKICIASKAFDVPLEINFLGIRDNRNYPTSKFWKLAGEEKCPVTFGFDAHSAKDAYDADSLEKAKEIVKEYQLNYIGMPELILI